MLNAYPLIPPEQASTTCRRHAFAIPRRTALHRTKIIVQYDIASPNELAIIKTLSPTYRIPYSPTASNSPNSRTSLIPSSDSTAATIASRRSAPITGAASP